MNDPGTNVGASTSSSATEYDLALAAYDSLVQEYENTAHSSDANIVVYEAKLIRAVCRVLNVRPPSARNALRPRLNEWLRVVGLSAPNIRHIELCGVHEVLTLIQKSEKETKSLAERGRYSPESKRRILRSCEAARNYLELLQGKREGVTFSDKQLSWSVKLSPSLKKTASYRGTSADTNSPLSPRFVITSVDQRTTGRESPGSADLLIPSGSGSGSFPGSPAPSVGHSRSASGSGSLSVLSGRATLSPSSPQSGSAHSTPTMGSTNRVVQSISMQFDPLDSQRSPKLNRLNHAIPHKWHRSNKFRLISDQMCTVCQRPLGFGFLNAWEKCRSCKWKVHTQCKSRIGDTCGLTPDHLRQVVERMISQHNMGMWNDPHTAPLHASHSHEPVFQYPPDPMNTIADSSSSTNSSAPSTPAALGIVSSPYNQFTAPARTEKRFTFPDTVQEVPDIVLPDPNDTAESPPSRDTLNIVVPKSLDVLEVHESLDGSEGTVIGGDSMGSGGTEGTEVSDGPTHQWDRSRWNMSTIRGGNAAASWNEVTIPPRDIDIKKNEVVGRGRFGYVMKATYFGDVVAKIFTMDHVEESRQLDEFRTEVANFKNTRHDNIVLFMGCILQGTNRWCIVMNRINGHSLHKILHENGQKMDLALAHNIGVQICQGISYLHTKKILHKDLRTKNVFFEKRDKVVITDFGITSMKRLRNPPREYSILVPQHWLVYQAPEIVASMATDGRELPFSEKSDAYSFGTIWFELLTCCFPFAGMHPDTITYFVGRGLQPPIPNIKTNKEAKPRVLEILTRCWSFSGDDRPSFLEIDQMLGSLPRRRLDRSPSFPVIRSFESNF